VIVMTGQHKTRQINDVMLRDFIVRIRTLFYSKLVFTSDE